MSIRLALMSCAVVAMLIGNLVVMLDRSQRESAVKNTTDEIVVNNVANDVTTIETEVYRVVCVEEKSGYCGVYSVRRIVKE